MGGDFKKKWDARTHWGSSQLETCCPCEIQVPGLGEARVWRGWLRRRELVPRKATF